MESIRPSSHSAAGRAVLALLAIVLAGAAGHAQAPTPSTSGLPTGVVRLPSSQQPQSLPMRWNRPRCGMTRARLG